MPSEKQKEEKYFPSLTEFSEKVPLNSAPKNISPFPKLAIILFVTVPLQDRYMAG